MHPYLIFGESRQFYRDLGFEESEVSKDLSFFKVNENLGFYLQDYYIKDWINNSIIFLEVDDVDRYWNELQNQGLDKKYQNVRLSPIKIEDWGKEYFLHDPSGFLWHFGEFF